LYESVLNVLKELEVVGKPIITVLNKIDKLEKKDWLKDLEGKFDDAVCISAHNKDNLLELLEKVGQKLSGFTMEINVTIPIKRMDLVNLAHEEGEVYSIKYYAKTVNIRAVIPVSIARKFYNAVQKQSRDLSIDKP